MRKFDYSPILHDEIKSDYRTQHKEAIELQRRINQKTNEELQNELPILPKDRMEWEYYCRPKIKGQKNRLKYLPMLKEIVLDEHPFIMGILARQWGKTATLIGSDLAYHATINYDYDQLYLNFKDAPLKTFSENKFRQDVFGTWPLSLMIKSSKNTFGSMERVTMQTRSIIDMLLPGPQWQNVLGKSPMKMKIDEGQDHNWEGFQNARDAQSDTFGDVAIFGVGGFQDTEYDNIWKTTNQCDWHFKDNKPYKNYDNMSWRKKLSFNSDGLIYDDYLYDVLDGKYIPNAPKNYSRHGYRLSQLQNPRIPLTKEDAISLYHISPEFSVEWKEKDDPNFNSTLFRRNILAENVEGELKPIGEKDMMKLFDKNLSLTRADDVDYDAGAVIIGIDWGGGGKTIVWIWQCIDEKAPIFKLLWVEKVDTGDTDEQWEICRNLIDAYEADFIGVDIGGATDRTQKTVKRYGGRSRKIFYLKRPADPLPTIKEEIKQSLEFRYNIDRTFSLDRVIDLIKHPFKDKDFTSNRIILPGKDYEKIKWIVKQFVAIEGEFDKIGAGGQTYIRYFHADTSPDDALQACNYALIGWHIWKGTHTGHVGGGLDMTKKTNRFDASDMV